MGAHQSIDSNADALPRDICDIFNNIDPRCSVEHSKPDNEGRVSNSSSMLTVRLMPEVDLDIECVLLNFSLCLLY
jgi:hypothetical protein